MVTLCASRDRVDGAACLGRLVDALAGIGADLRRMVLDLDCAPYPAPANAVAAVDAWAAEREVTVVALGLTPSLCGFHLASKDEVEAVGLPTTLQYSVEDLTRIVAEGPSSALLAGLVAVGVW